MKQRIAILETPKGFLDGLMKTGAYITNSGLDHKLLHLLAYRVSQINGCAFCLDMHHKDAIHAGETEQRLHGLPAWRETPWYSEAEKAALQFAEALTTHCETDDATYEILALHFNKEDIARLALAVATTNTWNRLNKVFLTTPGNYEVNQFAAA
ncbi:MAG TPA: carboxymuconolactone decarboxylase family protein [Puia sp.]|jgi:AhpD family alkylhydroperoxidase